VTPEHFSDAMAWMVDVGAAWDDRLAKLRRSLAANLETNAPRPRPL